MALSTKKLFWKVSRSLGLSNRKTATEEIEKIDTILYNNPFRSQEEIIREIEATICVDVRYANVLIRALTPTNRKKYPGVPGGFVSGKNTRNTIKYEWAMFLNFPNHVANVSLLRALVWLNGHTELSKRLKGYSPYRGKAHLYLLSREYKVNWRLYDDDIWTEGRETLTASKALKKLGYST
jgi:hypothetical protein